MDILKLYVDFIKLFDIRLDFSKTGFILTCYAELGSASNQNVFMTLKRVQCDI